MTYEDFFTPEEIATYRKVKLGSMRISSIARGIAARMVGGFVDDEGREFVRTHVGTFYLCMAHNSLNTTERYAIQGGGVAIVVMGDEAEMSAWLNAHDVNPQEPPFFEARVRLAVRATTDVETA